MAFAQDLDRLTAVLRSSAVENSVDPGMLLALLESHASHEQRVDLVILDLQKLLGREIHIGAHQVGLNYEVQNVDDIQIEYEHLIPRPAQRQKDPDVLVLSMAQPNERTDRPTLPTGNGIEQERWDEIQNVDDDITIDYEHLMPRPSLRREEPDVLVPPMAQRNDPKILPDGNSSDKKGLDDIQNVDDIRIEYQHLMPRQAQTQEEPDVLVPPMAHPNDPTILPAGNGPDPKGRDDIQNVDDIRIEYEHLMPRPAQTQEEPDILVLPMAQSNDSPTRPGNSPDRNGWNDEIQNVDDIRIEYEHLIPRSAQRQEEPDVHKAQLAAEYDTGRTTVEITNVGTTKRKIPVRDAATGVDVSSTDVANAASASTSNFSTYQQRHIIQPKRTISTNPITAPLNHTFVSSPNQPGSANANADPIGYLRYLIDYYTIPQAQGNPMIVLVKPPETNHHISLIKESNETSTTPQEREAMAVKFFHLLFASGPVLHVKFAAYKAAEFATLKNSAQHLDEFIRNQSHQMVKTNQYWDPPEKENVKNQVNQGSDPPETGNAEHQRLFQHVYEEFINEQVDFFVTTLPDADPEFIEEQIRGFNGDQERIQSLLTQFFEGENTFPSRADYNNRKANSKLAHTSFTVEEFIDLYGDPFKQFGVKTRATDKSYRNEALNQLKLDFRRVGFFTLRKLFIKHNYHYWPTYQEVSKNTLISQERKTSRSLREFKQFKPQNLFLIQEIAFVRLQAEIETYMENKEQMRWNAVALARQNNNALFECPICCEEELVESDMAMCPSGHEACRSCVRRHAEELIGMMKNHIPCLDPSCDTEYALDVLKEILGEPTFNRLEKRLQVEEIMAAEIEGLESCPFCDYAHVPRDTDMLFECQNPKCQKVSCRACREAYHSPVSCEEAIKQRFSNYVETKMTEALVRECPSCKIKFVKSEGCNRMTCIKCNAVMCYVCRKQIRGSENHFDDRQPNPEGKCPQHSDTNKMHDEEVAKSAEQAKAELAKSNPNVRVDLVLAHGSREGADKGLAQEDERRLGMDGRNGGWMDEDRWRQMENWIMSREDGNMVVVGIYDEISD